MWVFIEGQSASAMAVHRQVAVCLRCRRRSLRQQLGLLHYAEYTSAVPQGRPQVRPAKC